MSQTMLLATGRLLAKVVHFWFEIIFNTPWGWVQLALSYPPPYQAAFLTHPTHHVALSKAVLT